MKSITFTIFALALTAASGYHDPDLNYHLGQLQKLQGCGDNNGYSYPAPAVQLTTAGVKVAAPVGLASPLQQAQTYQYSNAGYSNAGYANAGYTNAGYANAAYTNAAYANAIQPSAGIAYQTPVLQKTYIQQQPKTYQVSSLGTQSNYPTASATKEVHGYATSAGLSSASSQQRTVIPQATYAQAPILAKVTAAPLIARFSVSPAKTTYVAQTFGDSGSARASLNTYGAVQTGGPVVSQVYAAPAATYATSSALQNQQPQVFTDDRFTPSATSPPTQYNQVGQVYSGAPLFQAAPAVTQYTTSHGASATGYFSPAQYSAPAVRQYTAPNVATVTHYGNNAVLPQAAVPAPAPVAIVQQPPVQYTAPAVTHYATPAATQYSSQQYATAGAIGNFGVRQHSSLPAVAHIVAPIQAQVAVHAPVTRIASAPVVSKNVHSEFVQNYDAHPRYAYEYSVNDPHTGDIKHQKEERDGEVVKGQYSLVEPDGSVRTVNYVADWETGFHADVRNSKDNHH